MDYFRKVKESATKIAKQGVQILSTTKTSITSREDNDVVKSISPIDELNRLFKDITNFLDNLSLSPDADSWEADIKLHNSNIRDNLKRIIILLKYDCEKWISHQRNPNQDMEDSLTPCIDLFLQLNIIQSLASRAMKDYPKGLLPLVLTTFSTLLRVVPFPLIPHHSVHKPLAKLITVASRYDVILGGNRRQTIVEQEKFISYKRRVDISLTSLIRTLWRKIKENPPILDYFILVDKKSSPGRLSIPSPNLSNRIHLDIFGSLLPLVNEPKVSYYAQESLLLALNVNDSRIDDFITTHTWFFENLIQAISDSYLESITYLLKETSAELLTYSNQLSLCHIMPSQHHPHSHPTMIKQPLTPVTKSRDSKISSNKVNDLDKSTSMIVTPIDRLIRSLCLLQSFFSSLQLRFKFQLESNLKKDFIPANFKDENSIIYTLKMVRRLYVERFLTSTVIPSMESTNEGYNIAVYNILRHIIVNLSDSDDLIEFVDSSTDILQGDKRSGFDCPLSLLNQTLRALIVQKENFFTFDILSTLLDRMSSPSKTLSLASTALINIIFSKLPPFFASETLLKYSSLSSTTTTTSSISSNSSILSSIHEISFHSSFSDALALSCKSIELEWLKSLSTKDKDLKNSLRPGIEIATKNLFRKLLHVGDNVFLNKTFGENLPLQTEIIFEQYPILERFVRKINTYLSLKFDEQIVFSDMNHSILLLLSYSTLILVIQDKDKMAQQVLQILMKIYKKLLFLLAELHDNYLTRVSDSMNKLDMIKSFLSKEAIQFLSIFSSSNESVKEVPSAKDLNQTPQAPNNPPTSSSGPTSSGKFKSFMQNSSAKLSSFTGSNNLSSTSAQPSIPAANPSPVKKTSLSQTIVKILEKESLQNKQILLGYLILDEIITEFRSYLFAIYHIHQMFDEKASYNQLQSTFKNESNPSDSLFQNDIAENVETISHLFSMNVDVPKEYIVDEYLEDEQDIQQINQVIGFFKEADKSLSSSSNLPSRRASLTSWGKYSSFLQIERCEEEFLKEYQTMFNSFEQLVSPTLEVS